MAKSSKRARSSKTSDGGDELSAHARKSLQEVSRLVDRGQDAAAEQIIAGTLVLAPEHPQVLRVLGVIHHRMGRLTDAQDDLARALYYAPGDVAALDALAAVQADAGRVDDAVSTVRRACEIAPGATTWFRLGAMFDRDGNPEATLDAAERCLQLDPGHVLGAFLRARSLQARGRIADTASQYRDLIARGEVAANAWFSGRFSYEAA